MDKFVRCSICGEIDEEIILRWATKATDKGGSTIILSDTLGRWVAVDGRHRHIASKIKERYHNNMFASYL